MNYPGKPIEKGQQGDIVKAIQRQLNIKGYGPLKTDGDFGNQTLADVEALQQAYHLVQDGIVGPATWDILFETNLPTTGISGKALEIIVTQLGQKEIPHGSNSGPMVNEYLKSVGLNPGYSWCQSLVYWSYNQAALQLGVNNPVIRTAGVIDCWNRSNPANRISAKDAIKNPALIVPGCQMILDYGHGTGHTGLVERMDGSSLVTIEGNSNNDGSRDGEMVVRQTKRKLMDKVLLGFIKY